MATLFPAWLARFLPFTLWLPLLDRKTVHIDLVAGFTAGVLILPQAVALATLAGMPPEYGLYTSIFPVIVAALFGSSWHNMSGPNTSLAILIAATVAPMASQMSDEYVHYVIFLTLLAGVIQLALGALRLGSVFNYISSTVIVGMTAAVGVLIVIQQLGGLFGIVLSTREPVQDYLLQLVYSLDRANPYALLVGGATVAAGLLVKRRYPKAPHIILAVLVGVVVAAAAEHLVGAYTANLDKLGNLTLAALPFSLPVYDDNVSAHIVELVIGATLVALLGLMQSAVISQSMATKTGQRVDMNQEIVGQGLANVAGSFLSSFVSCGSFNRSAANIEAGARTPLASLASAVVLAGIVVFAAPLISAIPLAVMSGILILVGYGLIKPAEIRRVLKVRQEALVFLAAFLLTVFSGLDTAVVAGVAISAAAYLYSTAKPAATLQACAGAHDLLPSGTEGHVLTLKGNLYFGAAPELQRLLTEAAARDRSTGVLVVDGRQMQHLDISAAAILAQEARNRKKQGGALILGLPASVSADVLEAGGITAAIGANLTIHQD